MAYMSQENKATKSPQIKALLKQYHLKGTISVRHHSTLVLNISEGSIDFIGNYNAVAMNNTNRDSLGDIQINPYWYKEHFSGPAYEFLTKAFDIMDQGNFDESDLQTDYFHCGWYSDINVGRWDKPYVVKG